MILSDQHFLILSDLLGAEYVLPPGPQTPNMAFLGNQKEAPSAIRPSCLRGKPQSWYRTF